MKVCSQFATGLFAGAALGLTALEAAGGGLQPQGLEFPLTRGIPGDQVNPSISLNRGGGWILWQDAAIDGQGLGIAALRITEDGSATGAPLKVNQDAEGDQENPSILALPDGRHFCLWQSGTPGFQHVRGRILSRDGSFSGPDFAISTGDGEHQIDPVGVVLADGSVVVAWAAYRQNGSLAYDVFGRRLSNQGVPVGDEFQLNSTTGYNRRSPALAALPSGGFLAGWISERQFGIRDNRDARGRAIAGAGAPLFSVQLVTRPFSATAEALGTEKVASETGFAANPVLGTAAEGRIYAAWTRRDATSLKTRFDVYGRLLTAEGDPVTPERLINVQTDGDQYRPRLAITSHGVLAVWTSMGQDGSWEGVFGRWIDGAGEPSGDEIPVNSQSGGSQLFPAVAVTPDSGMLVAWSSNQPRTGYELFAQRLAPLLLKVRSAGAGQLRLQWPTLAGGVYQLQSSTDAKAWKNIGSTRTASGDLDELAISAPGQMVLYRIVRVR